MFCLFNKSYDVKFSYNDNETSTQDFLENEAKNESREMILGLLTVIILSLR